MRMLPLIACDAAAALLVTLAACAGQGPHEIAPCDSADPQGQVVYVQVSNERIRVQIGIGAGARSDLTDHISVRVGDVLTIEDVDPSRPNLGSGDSVTCLFGSGHADGPPGTPPSDDRDYAVVRHGTERLTINPHDATRTYTLTITSKR